MDPTERMGWMLGLGGSLLLGLFLTSQLYVWVNLWPVSITWGEAALGAVPHLLVWLALVPGVLELSKRFPIAPPRIVWRVLFHAVASVGAATLGLVVLGWSDRLVHWTGLAGLPGWIVTNLDIATVNLHLGIGIYWVVLALQHALHYRAESQDRELTASRLEAQLAEARLRALRMQLNPHFLFNTLNSIDVLVRRDVEGARAMLHGLAELLHTTLEHGDREGVTLREELAYLEAYLRLQERRFGDRLEVRWAVDDDVLGCTVPFLVLQPLVENALEHGLAPRASRGAVEIAGARTGQGGLVLEVRDDGVGIPPGWSEDDFGVGLTNTALRLEALFGGEAGLEVRPREGGGTTVRIRMPAVQEPRSTPGGTEDPSGVAYTEVDRTAGPTRSGVGRPVGEGAS